MLPRARAGGEGSKRPCSLGRGLRLPSPASGGLLGTCPRHERPTVPERSQREPRSELTADEVEQRQRADGTWEEPTITGPDDGPLTPDQIEQRRGLDGSLEGAPDDLASDVPLTPDVLEQRQVVEDDGADDHPSD
jgi:hypothetical protein